MFFILYFLGKRFWWWREGCHPGP